MTVMMRGSTLARLSLAHKAALSGFLVLALIHVLGISAAMAWMHSGMTSRQIVDHYRGNEEDPQVTVDQLQAPKSTREILTLTHYHMAVMPVFTFLLCHILAITAWPGERAKVLLITLSYLSVAVEVSIPWIAMAYPDLVVLRHASRDGLVVMTLVGALIPLKEMWWDTPS